MRTATIRMEAAAAAVRVTWVEGFRAFCAFPLLEPLQSPCRSKNFFALSLSVSLKIPCCRQQSHDPSVPSRLAAIE